MRPRSLVQRFRKCGKPNRRCAKRGAPGHGLYWILARRVRCKTVTKAIPDGAAVEQTRDKIQQYQRFRELVRRSIKVVLREAIRRRIAQAQPQAAIGDGSPWIWKVGRELLPGAIQNVDKFHIKEHLSQLAKLLYSDLANPRAGLSADTKHWIAAALRICCARCIDMPTTATRPANASGTCIATGNGCATDSSREQVFTLAQALWKLLYGSRGNPPQEIRDVVDRPRSQRHHRLELLQAQWNLTGLLGTPVQTCGGVNSSPHFYVVHPS